MILTGRSDRTRRETSMSEAPTPHFTESLPIGSPTRAALRSPPRATFTTATRTVGVNGAMRDYHDS